MHTPRISASSYSNTAPLIWSFLYGSLHGSVELILDNAPARSAELLRERRVDAALVPVVAYHEIEDVRLVRDVCVAAKESVKSVCLVTRGRDLRDVGSVALDVSSRTSVVLTKLIFREFLGFEPEWRNAEPNVGSMLESSDCALLIGDPALSILESSNAERGTGNAESPGQTPDVRDNEHDTKDKNSEFRIPNSALDTVPNSASADVPGSEIRKFDLAELWRHYTGCGFVFAMWMTRSERSPVDFASARDEGLDRIGEIVSNYLPDIKIGEEEFRRYLLQNISYRLDEDLERGMQLYFRLAKEHGLCEPGRELSYTR